MNLFRPLISILSLCASLLAQNSAQLGFTVPPRPGITPLAREIDATVELPSGTRLSLPAYAEDSEGTRFAIRVRGTELGAYRLRSIRETINGLSQELPLPPADSSSAVVRQLARPQVRLDPRDSRQFSLSDGSPYVPIGFNLPWAEGAVIPYFSKALSTSSASGVNWTRIWMAHWSLLNLEWLPSEKGPNPALGTVSPEVAANWDAIVKLAEDSGVYFQMVFQHHGQISTAWDSNWQNNPWNTALGGFLSSPNDFFKHPKAIELSRQKYRYIIARWGYSTAIMAWELFNEVHNTDPARATPSREPEAAAWHRSMAAYLRSIDTYRHLITTSHHDLHSLCYADMDFYQPHLYASNILAAVRRFEENPELMDKPLLYGEFGDDQTFLPQDVVQQAAALPSIMWASIMGTGRFPALPWTGESLIRNNRLPEITALARFIHESGLAGRSGMQPFSPAVVSKNLIPLRIEAGHWWMRLPSATLDFPTDGSSPSNLYDIPRAFVGAPGSVAYGYPNKVTIHIDYPKDSIATLRINKVGRFGARMRLMLDDLLVASHIWPATKENETPTTQGLETAFPVSAGSHTLVLDNPGGPDWFELKEIDTGLEVAALSAVGKRAPDLITLWVCHRNGLGTPASPAEGELLLQDVPAGEWSLVWWDSLNGIPGKPTLVRHPGGTLRLATPAIVRHAALVLRRQ